MTAYKCTLCSQYGGTLCPSCREKLERDLVSRRLEAQLRQPLADLYTQ